VALTASALLLSAAPGPALADSRVAKNWLDGFLTSPIQTQPVSFLFPFFFRGEKSEAL
jgi:hypothetical protein